MARNRRLLFVGLPVVGLLVGLVAWLGLSSGDDAAPAGSSARSAPSSEAAAGVPQREAPSPRRTQSARLQGDPQEGQAPPAGTDQPEAKKRRKPKRATTPKRQRSTQTSEEPTQPVPFGR